MIDAKELYVQHNHKTHVIEVDHVEWDKAIFSSDKRKLRKVLRNLGVCGKLSSLIKQEGCYDYINHRDVPIRRRVWLPCR